jgi:hypothetical protein
VPVVQRGHREGHIQAAGGLQQHIQQALHLGAGGRLPLCQGKAKPSGDRGANLAWIEQLPFNGGGAQAFAAQQRRDRLQIQRRLKPLQPAEQVVAFGAGLRQQRLQNGTLPAEMRPVRLLPDPG